MATRAKSRAPASARPTGNVTFLFSDIEGSTSRWESSPDAMAPALERHDKLMRAAIEARGGYVFKTIGDAFCAAFAMTSDAIAAALEAQRSLASEDFAAVEGIRVRMALHCGQSAERDGDYFGPTVNRVARLLATGHGGQVLVSRECTELLQGETLPLYSLLDLGEHRLKDLARPERVYQLLAPDLIADFPPLRSLGTFANNLPLQLSSFVGRETEIAEIATLVETHRLVTLSGAGGVGKTRTSLQVAANLLDGSGDGVWFVELAPLTSGDYIPSTLAQTLGLTLATEGDPVQNLVGALKEKRTLLVLDNCEHLVEPAARVISAILHGCPSVKVLASSRQALGIQGEMTYRMPSLDVPAAISLFVDRARGVDERFAVTDENAPIVADICRRLDGIPLAIELASSRVKMLTPKQLRERLDERFRVLTGGSRDLLPRQQTLRALIDWSHDLLDERERTLFRRLGIFVNGFTLEGASAVCSAEDLDELDVFDVLGSLVDKSLVQAEPDGESLRYRLLESTRVYAIEKLAAAGEREACANRHVRYLRDRFGAARERWERTVRNDELDDALASELEDVRAALDAALGGPDLLLGAELLAYICSRFTNAGLESEGLARINAFVAAIPAKESGLLATLLTAASYFEANSGRKARAFETAEQAVAYARMSADVSICARALRAYAGKAAALGRLDDAEKAQAEAEATPGESAALRLSLLHQRAFLSGQRGDHSAAARAYEQLRQAHRAMGNTYDESVMTFSLAEEQHACGQTQLAIGLARELVVVLRTQRDRLFLANTLTNLAGYLAAVDDLPGTRDTVHEAIRELAREPESAYVATAIEHLALALERGGDLTRAATLAGYADATLQRHGFRRQFTETTTRDRLTTLLRENLAPDELERLSAQGAALAPEAAVALALES